MNTKILSSRADLEIAEGSLRSVLIDEFREEAKADAQSLDRMLTHLVNMQGAIADAPEIHTNVAKRLSDFATTTLRMASRNPEAAAKLTRLSVALRSASERLITVTSSVSSRSWSSNVRPFRSGTPMVLK